MALPDALDCRILALLDGNGRLSVSEIARVLRHGRDTIDYRIQRLVSTGIITKFTAVINPGAYGYSIYKVYLRLNVVQRQRDALLSSLSSHPRVFWLAECDGTWDILFSIVALDHADFDLICQDILSKFTPSILQQAIVPLVTAHLFRKKYLKPSELGAITIGGRVQARSMDKTDLGLLALLGQNARASVVSMAERLSVSPDVVTGRQKRLEEDEIIKGYRAELDLAKLSRVFFKAQLVLYGSSPTIEDSIYQFCYQHPQITYLIYQLGQHRVEVEIEALDYYGYCRVVGELRDKFSEVIRSVETVLVRTDRYKGIYTSP